MKPRKLRHRKCNNCGATNPAGTFQVVERGSHWNPVGGTQRICPSCGAVGVTQAFPMVVPRR